MSEYIDMTVNKKKERVSTKFGSSAADLLTELGFDADRHALYRTGHLPDGADVTEDDRCGDPLVVGEGDSFLVIPNYVLGGG